MDENTAGDNSSNGHQPIRRLTVIFIALAALFLLWYVLADRYTPMTSEARVRGYVVPIATEVSGPIVEIDTVSNKLVEADDVLLQIDRLPFQLAVDKAQAELESMAQNLGSGQASVVAAETQLANANTEMAYVNRQSVRVLKLEKDGVISTIQADKVRTTVETAKINVANAEAHLLETQSKVGIDGDENPAMRQALVALQQAQLNLRHTTVRAPAQGVATNFTLDVGQYAAAGQPLMTFISTRGSWVEAYMRENTLANIEPGDKVELVLDVAPGRVFQGRVVSTGYGIDWGQKDSAGKLPSISGSRGWLRDPQRFPVMIAFADDQSLGFKRIGGQADVVIYSGDSWVMNTIATVSIRFTSLISYLH